jgi:gliding motility-associated-like protein
MYKNALLPLLLFCSLLLMPEARAQVPNDQATYDAWKATQLGEPEPIIITPDMLDGGMAGQRSTCDCWIEPDASYTTINNSSQWNATGFNNADDGSHGPINLPFPFQLYGLNQTTAFININGNISFGQTYTTFTSTGFPVTGPAIVAPFWADVDLRGNAGPGNNTVRYKVTPTALYVNWIGVGYYNMQVDKLNNFQVIITNGTDPAVPGGANVSFCYGDMAWTTGSASGGSGGFGGTAATVGANRGNGVDFIQFGRFNQPGMAYDGPFGANDGVDWLDDKFFYFSTDIATGNVPPVVASQSVCDSLILCVGELANLDMVFLSPEPDQITVADFVAPTLSNFTIVTNTSGVSAQIEVEFTPLPADVGFHEITFTATDNGTPPMTTTYSVVVQVQQGFEIDPAELAVCQNGPVVDLLDVLSGAPPGGEWTTPSGDAHSGTLDPSTDAPGDYLYAIGAGLSCASTGLVSVSIQPPPNAGTDATVSICTTDDAIELFPLLGGAPDANGSWINPNGQPFTTDYDPATHIGGAYRYIVPGVGPCANDTATVMVERIQAVDAGLDATLTLCMDATPLEMLGALGGNPDGTGTWTGPAGPVPSGIFNVDTDPVGEYTYTMTAAAPCPSQSSTLTLATDPLPNAGGDATVVRCADAAMVPLFPLLGAGTDVGGQWQHPTGQVHSGTLDPAADPSGEYLYIVTGIGACAHRVDTAVVAVTVNPLPEVDFMAEPLAGCAPLEVTLENTTPPQYAGGECTWNFGDGSSGPGCGTVTHWYQDPGVYSVTLTVTTPEGCTDDLFMPGLILVEAPPEAVFLFSPNPGTELNNTIRFFNEDPRAILFEWTVDGVPFGAERNAEYTFNNVIGDEYEVCLRVEDRYGCEDSHCRIVPIVIPTIFVPNAFTPDGDGLNDVFRPVFVDVDPEHHELMIFDRWGDLVFRTTDPNEGWDGRHRRGGPILPQGVYVWRLTTLPRYTADKVERTGTVTLLK